MPDVRLLQCRSIPACAGEPYFPAHDCRAPGVYPRVCGGTSKNSVGICLNAGLSPRVRGNRQPPTSQTRRIGSIPACAGEPLPRFDSCCPPWVYPRVCGGTNSCADRSTAPMGLSPRVRGNQILGRCNSVVQRSIPACAGEPAARRKQGRETEVYPRVCGGTGGSTTPTRALAGLSPRVRGNPHRPRRTPRRPWSIPACAGEPWPQAPPMHRGTVYPRVCGGTPRRRPDRADGHGLSPRVRGNLDAATRAAQQ